MMFSFKKSAFTTALLSAAMLSGCVPNELDALRVSPQSTQVVKFSAPDRAHNTSIGYQAGANTTGLPNFCRS